jgi:hypothetical protein
VPAGRPRQGKRCKGRLADGRPCPWYAINGAEVCRRHGGASPQVRRKAEMRVAQRKALAAYKRLCPGDPEPADPAEIPERLLRVVAERHHVLAATRARLAELAGGDWPDDPAAWQAYTDALDGYQHALTEVAKLGLEERAVRLAEGQAEWTAAIVDRVIRALGRDPAEPAMRALVRQIWQATPPGLEAS